MNPSLICKLKNFKQYDHMKKKQYKKISFNETAFKELFFIRPEGFKFNFNTEPNWKNLKR